VTEEEKYFDILEKIQEPQGYFSNLLVNKVRYGYMACPCRLASGDRGEDRDIICPCLYREKDVKEYGSCYCNLYVSREWNEGKIPHAYVPERRPPEK
jgi:ferredoxin-thioredoxin reductase catalytic chain